MHCSQLRNSVKLAELKPFLIDLEARARAIGGKDMKCPKCGMDSIFDVSTLKMSEFLPFTSHACLRCSWTSGKIIQPERMSERAPEGETIMISSKCQCGATIPKEKHKEECPAIILESKIKSGQYKIGKTHSLNEVIPKGDATF